MLSLEQAQAVVASALEKADSMQKAVTVTVVDSGGDAVAFARMDGCPFGYIDCTDEGAIEATRYIQDYFDGEVVAIPLYSDLGFLLGAIAVGGKASETDLRQIALAGKDITD